MNTQTPAQSCCPPKIDAYPQGMLARMAGLAASWVRSRIKAFRARPRVRVVPVGSPEARVEKPGERRVVFNNRVMIIESRQPREPRVRDRSD